MTPVECYADGGVVRVNPSPVGGTWAWVHVSPDGTTVEAGGSVTPADMGTETVSNNVSEFLALLLALEALPAGWSGRVFSDSGVTIQRFRDGAKTKGVPAGLVERLPKALARLGRLEYVLLGGHPNRKELAAGVRKDGKPVSRFNVRCDERCAEEAEKLVKELEGAGRPHPDTTEGTS